MAFDREKFFEALGAKKAWIGYTYPNPGSTFPHHITGIDDPELRNLVKINGSDKFFEALSAGTDNPDAKALIKTIQGKPDLAKALHEAAYKDETVLAGLEKLTKPGSAGGISAAQIQAALTTPGIGEDFTKGLTETLNKVANGPDEFDAVITFGKNYDFKGKFNLQSALGSMDKLFSGMANNPMGFMQKWTGGLAGTDLSFLGGFFKFLAEAFGNMLGPLPAAISRIGTKIGVLNYQADKMYANPHSIEDTSQIDYRFAKSDFIKKYNEIEAGTSSKPHPTKKYATITGKAARPIKTNEDFVKALKEIDPSATEEVNLVLNKMRGDTELNDAVTKLRGEGAEGLNKVYELMVAEVPPGEAFKKAASGITGADVRATQAVFAKATHAVNQAATVSVTDDAKFSAKVEGNLTSSSPASISSVYNAVLTSVPNDAKLEIRDLGKGIDQNGLPDVTSTFARWAAKINNAPAGSKKAAAIKEVAKEINDDYNKMEAGKAATATTPATPAASPAAAFS